MNESRLRLTFSPDFNNVNLVRAALRGICDDVAGSTEDGGCYPLFCLAVVEALNNAVEHSGSPAISLDILVGQEELRCRLITTGPRFDSTAPATLPENSSVADAAEGGYGLVLMQEMSDGLEYEYCDGQNILTLVKRIYGKTRKG